MYNALDLTIQKASNAKIESQRIQLLNPLVEFMQMRLDKGVDINLNFICTHNSRRSHLCQVWAQIMAAHFKIQRVYCYSGGTEATAVYPMIVSTLNKSGIMHDRLSVEDNPVYMLKYADNTQPIICFSKKYNHSYNPVSSFAAVMTCSDADENCPVILGADIRIPITYLDPKVSDNTDRQELVYAERSLQIVQEMRYVFAQLKVK